MRRCTAFILSVLCLCQIAVKSQPIEPAKDRKTVIEEARYLRSIYRTEKAIEMLTGLLGPEQFDEEVMNELADCHLQAGDLESAANTYSAQIFIVINIGKQNLKGTVYITFRRLNFFYNYIK